MLSQELAGQAQSILDFAIHLEHILNNKANLTAQELPDFSSYFAVLPFQRKDLSPEFRIEFDRKGVALWNKCCNLDSSDDSQGTRISLAKVRAFSYFLLESAGSIKRKSHPRLFKIAIKASKSCLNAGLLDIASEVIGQLASKQEQLSKSADHDDLNVDSFPESFRAQYLLLRIALVWRQHRLDLAEHFYVNQLESLQHSLVPERIGELVDLCYEIGDDQLNQKQASLAAKWLGRGCQILFEHSTLMSEADNVELKLSLMHTHVRALLASDNPEDQEGAIEALKTLCKEFPQKLAVILLQMEQYVKDPTANATAFYFELMKVVRSVHLIPSNHKLILHYVHHLKRLSVVKAIRVLDAYIVTRLAPNGEEELTEGTVITLIWLMTSDGVDDVQLKLSDVEESFNKVHQAWGNALSAEATHGVLVLFWKQIEHAFHHDLRDRTVRWCQLALHPLFSNAGDHNIGKLERKIVKCYIDLSKLDAAQEVLETMSSARKQHALSRYLRYTLALRRGNEEEARSALASLATLHDGRNRLLFAAASEALRYGGKTQGALLLQRILDKYNDNLPPEIDAFALLRCTARLLISAVSEPNAVNDELLSRLCGIFKSAALSTQKYQMRQQQATELLLQESRWFEKTSYNTAVQYLKSWPARYLIDLLHYSCQIQYPANVPQGVYCDKLIHEVNSKYIQAILSTVQARSTTPLSTTEDLPKTSYSGKAPPCSPTDIKLTLYRNVFNNYTQIHSHISTLHGSTATNHTTKEVTGGTTQKQIVLAPLAFEALLFMQRSSTYGGPEQGPTAIDEPSLKQIIDQAMALNPPQKTFSIFADMVLSAGTGKLYQPDPGMSGPPVLPASTTVNLLGKLITGLRSYPSYDAAQGAKWIRCMIQVVLDQLETRAPKEMKSSSSDSPDIAAAETHFKKNLSTLAKLTQHALIFARSNNTYPAEELQWLATMLFNLAIDLYLTSSSSSSASTSGFPDGTSKPETGESKATESDGDTQPEPWAKRAVEFAEVLALNTSTRNKGGDDVAMLVRTLRERCHRFKWDV
ncbi:hypothetical protein PV04_07333 [Phialophora macrospora]|uniref:Protein ZIP4 homolog n=1 Tax=Phialophora macrospora TaxID=1851006 RepID=A0A0D2CIM6_9EURO|nr:hypothetical protein PV04_07333 [Phialophora macrospora]